MAGGIRFLAVAFVTVAAAAPQAVAAAADATGPTPAKTSPAATSVPASQQSSRTGTTARDPAGGVGVLPSSENEDLTRLLLIGLVGVLTLIVIPTQIAKGVAQRRRAAAVATSRARRSRRRP